MIIHRILVDGEKIPDIFFTKERCVRFMAELSSLLCFIAGDSCMIERIEEEKEDGYRGYRP